MKNLVVAAVLLFSGFAFADAQLEVKVIRIDMAVTAPEEDESEAKKGVPEIKRKDVDASTPSAPKAATDHNASRSNSTSTRDSGDDEDGAEAKTCVNDADTDCDAPRDASPADHNSTRSK